MSCDNLTRKVMLWGSAALAAGIAITWFQEWRRKKRLFNMVPTTWIPVGEISQMILYPLKSGRGISPSEAYCTPKGLRITDKNGFSLMDRTFMVYNEESGGFMTARQQPKMVLINVSLDADGKVVFTTPVMRTKLKVQIPSENNPTIPCSMWWEEEVYAYDCGPDAAAWFSRFIIGKRTGLRLGYFVDKQLRSMDSIPWAKYKKHFTKLRKSDFGAFADMASYMLVGSSSIADLNTRLQNHVTAKRFRPNFVVSGLPPYIEDEWDWIRIGKSIIMRCVKPCTRCAIVTIHPESGEMDVGHEPLKTLKRYRKLTDPAAIKLEGDCPVLGVYAGLHQAGKVKVGDVVYVGKAHESCTSTSSMDQYEENLRRWWS